MLNRTDKNSNAIFATNKIVRPSGQPSQGNDGKDWRDEERKLDSLASFLVNRIGERLRKRPEDGRVLAERLLPKMIRGSGAVFDSSWHLMEPVEASDGRTVLKCNRCLPTKTIELKSDCMI